MIASPTVLLLLDLGRSFEIEVDASKSGFGCVLLQEHNGILRPRGFYSRVTTKLEKKWAHPNKLEARCLVWAARKLDLYLRHRPFVIRTDARNLLFLLNREHNSGGIFARRLLVFCEYTFIIQHALVPGADALSRASGPGAENFENGVVADDDDSRLVSCRSFFT